MRHYKWVVLFLPDGDSPWQVTPFETEAEARLFYKGLNSWTEVYLCLLHGGPRDQVGIHQGLLKKEKLLEKTMGQRYPIGIFPAEDEEEEYYFVFLPDFGASVCNATGYTIAEALDTLNEVKEEVIRNYIDKGREIPEPSKAIFETKKVERSGD